MLNFIEKVPSYDEYNSLKTELGWKVMSEEKTMKGLHNSTLSISVYDDDQFVGMGRIVGDDAMVYVISNIMIKPDYHHQGIGSKIMGILMNYLDENCSENAMVMLMSRKETEEFYKKFGFICRPSKDGGSGMCKYY